MNKLKKPELLAPAGDLNKLQTALAFGADAVYFGVPDFSLRVRINDFSWEDITTAIKYTHEQGKKAYVTLNILAHNHHLPRISDHVKQLKPLAPDAIFISDPGVMLTVREAWPEAKLSLSTQANCTNWQSAQFWRDQGFSRIILSREMSLADIQEIITKVPDVEIEVFVHGALCSSYSGRCFISDYLNDRSANQGDCTQPCRWEYELKPAGHDDKSLILGEDANGSYILNSRDLCLIERLPEIIASGVSAIKIEGRAKSAYYLANVVGTYRRAIDLICDSGESKTAIAKELKFLREELTQKLRHRGYSEGFMFRGDDHLQNLSGVNFIPDWEFCGQVVNCQADDTGAYDLTINVHNAIFTGDELEIISPAYEVYTLVNTKMTAVKDGQDLSEAHGGAGADSVVIIKVNKPYPVLSVMRRHLMVKI